MKLRNVPVPVWGLSLARLLLALAVLAANGILFAQTDRGIIEGLLTDPTGAAVPNAKVQVTNIETNSTLDFFANELGNYLAPNLPTGSYRITVQKEGFRSVVREPVLVRAQSRMRVDFTFQVGSATETVTVSAEAPLLDVSATSAPTNVTAKFIDELPMIVFGEKRNITDNLRFLPGNTSTNGSLGSGEPAESWSGRVNSAVQGAPRFSSTARLRASGVHGAARFWRMARWWSTWPSTPS